MLMKNRRTELGAICVIVSAILFGFMPLLSKIAYQHGSNAYTVAFGRFSIGCVFVFLLTLKIPNCRIRIAKENVIEFLKLSIPYGLVPVFLYISYEHIDSGLATTLHFTYPVMVVVLTSVFWKNRLGRKQIFCTILSMVGIVCLYTPDGQVSIQGIFYAMISGVVYALYIVLLERSPVKSLHPLIISFWLSFISAIEIGLLGWATNNLVFQMEAEAWAAEIVLAFLTAVVALVLFQQGVFWCGSVKASLLSSFEPLTGVIVGIVVFQESLQMKEFCGIAFILLAAIVLVLPGVRPHYKILTGDEV